MWGFDVCGFLGFGVFCGEKGEGGFFWGLGYRLRLGRDWSIFFGEGRFFGVLSFLWELGFFLVFLR